VTLILAFCFLFGIGTGTFFFPPGLAGERRSVVCSKFSFGGFPSRPFAFPSPRPPRGPPGVSTFGPSSVRYASVPLLVFPFPRWLCFFSFHSVKMLFSPWFLLFCVDAVPYAPLRISSPPRVSSSFLPYHKTSPPFFIFVLPILWVEPALYPHRQ